MNNNYDEEKVIILLDFYKVFKDLLVDLKNTFADKINPIIESNTIYSSILNYDLPFTLDKDDNIDITLINQDFLDALNCVFDHCLKIFPQRIFDILYHNEDIFNDDTDTLFFPNIDFSTLYYDDTSDSTKETLWKYLQVILFSIITRVNNENDFGSSTKLFEAINSNTFREKLEETVNGLGNLFNKNMNFENECNANECNANECNANECNANECNNDECNANNFDNMFKDVNDLFSKFDISNIDFNNVNNINFEELFNKSNVFNQPNVNFDQVKNLFDNLNIFNNESNVNGSNVNEPNVNESNVNEPNVNESANNFNNSKLPNSDEIFSHINNLINGKIGSLAKELAEETAADLNIDPENVSNVNDVFKQMFKNPNKLLNLVNNISSKLDKKMKDGSIKESELLEEASSLFKNMDSMPGMENFKDLFKSMNMDQFMPKGGKFNNNAFQHMMDQNVRMSKMKERMKKKAEKNSNTNNQSQNQNQSQSQNQSQNKSNLQDLNKNLSDLLSNVENNNDFIKDILEKQNSGSESKPVSYKSNKKKKHKPKK